MNDHYYTRVPQSESRPVDCEFTYRGIPLTFRTDAGVFSRGEVDTGTRLLLEALPEEMGGDVLDLGCGDPGDHGGCEHPGTGTEPGEREAEPGGGYLRGERRDGRAGRQDL